MKQEGGNKARRGRPAKPEGETLDAIIPATRCKSVERQAYEAAAERAGLTLSEWVRKTLNRGIKK